jgi:hypothetical protein
MNEITQSTEPESAVASEPSLDDVIAEYNVQPAAAPQALAPSEPVMPAQPAAAVVDPLDSGQFNNYVQQVNSGQSVLNTQLQDVKTELTELRQERAQLQIEADITSAVGKINEGHDLNPEIVRVHLELTAQNKPGFKALWENRTQNPKAFDAALSAVSREVGDLYANKQDPDLTANQRAMQQSQKSLAGTSVEGSDNSIESQLAAATTQVEWDRIWQRNSSTAQ